MRPLGCRVLVLLATSCLVTGTQRERAGWTSSSRKSSDLMSQQHNVVVSSARAAMRNLRGGTGDRCSKDTKFIVVTGGVLSGIGKGVTASSIGVLVKMMGMRPTAIKIDPYLVSNTFISASTYGSASCSSQSSIVLQQQPSPGLQYQLQR
jgi:CTP synthase N-terminus